MVEIIIVGEMVGGYHRRAIATARDAAIAAFQAAFPGREPGYSVQKQVLWDLAQGRAIWPQGVWGGGYSAPTSCPERDAIETAAMTAAVAEAEQQAAARQAAYAATVLTEEDWNRDWDAD